MQHGAFFLIVLGGSIGESEVPAIADGLQGASQETRWFREQEKQEGEGGRHSQILDG